ncbi:selenoprotein S isoform X2 [Syngnathoides biaculeatus]|uniref:selenoprotein S isoform X2 n=1 Tax=Syngnathoides biaculeatus TaxID=300417 RepID=UPI002ADE3780|nr:selenoprotein S isoform X2 [Syngnathoides biaculeatus]
MDEVEITDVDQNGDLLEAEEKQQPHNLPSFSLMAVEFLSAYGGYLLLALAAGYVLLLYLGKRRTRSGPGARDPLPAALQDAEAVVRRQEAMEASRRKMQQEQDAKAAIFREKQKQQEEERRRQRIEEWDSMQTGKSFKGAARRLQSSDDDAGASGRAAGHKKPLRNSEYSPLSGDGGSCSWRPARRGPSSGG